MADVFCKGAKLTIEMSEDFPASLAHVKNTHHKNIYANLARANALLRTLADSGRLRSPDQFRQEGEDMIYKAAGKLAKEDTSRMIRNQVAFRKAKRIR